MRYRRARCASRSVRSSSKAARSSQAGTSTGRTTTALRCARAGTASPYRCMRRCTPYSVHRHVTVLLQAIWRARRRISAVTNTVPNPRASAPTTTHTMTAVSRRGALRCMLGGICIALHMHGPSPPPSAAKRKPGRRHVVVAGVRGRREEREWWSWGR